MLGSHHHTSVRRILLTALLLGWIFDQLFYQQLLGISVPLFILLALGSLFLLGRRRGPGRARPNLWLMVLLLSCAALVAVRANAFVTTLNVLAVLATGAMLAHFYGGGQVLELELLQYPVILLRVALLASFETARAMPQAFDGHGVRHHGRRHVLPVFRGVLLATPLLLVFVSLLASADLVFADYVTSALELDLYSLVGETVEHSLVVLGVGWFVGGTLLYALLDRASEPAMDNLRLPQLPSGRGFIEASTVLALVNALFLVFVWIQFAYFFGGRENVLWGDFTYAEYARRGFFELLIIAFLTLTLILFLQWLVGRLDGLQGVFFNGLCSMSTMLVLVILASAFLRLRLYEEAYGYTELRLYVHVFMVWLALLLVWLFVTLWRPGDPERRRPSTRNFARGVFAASFGFLFTLNLLNPDAFIVRQNLARFHTSGKLDVFYLSALSTDALPELAPAVDELSGRDKLQLCSALEGWSAYFTTKGKSEPWYSTHLGRQRAARRLSETDWRATCGGDR